MQISPLPISVIFNCLICETDLAAKVFKKRCESFAANIAISLILRIGDQKISEKNEKLRPGCPPDYQNVCERIDPIFFIPTNP